MKTYFFNGNIKEILKYALSLDNKSHKQDYLQDVCKYLDEQLRFLDERILLQEENERKKYSSLRGAKFSISPEREAKIFYEQIINQILKLLTAIGEATDHRTDELLEQELQSLGQSMNDYSTNQVLNKFGYETQTITPAFKVIGIKGRQELRNSLAGSEKDRKSSRRARSEKTLPKDQRTQNQLKNRPKIRWLGTRKKLIILCKFYNFFTSENNNDEEIFEQAHEFFALKSEGVSEALINNEKLITWPYSPLELKYMLLKLTNLIKTRNKNTSGENIWISNYFEDRDNKRFGPRKLGHLHSIEDLGEEPKKRTKRLLSELGYIS